MKRVSVPNHRSSLDYSLGQLGLDIVRDEIGWQNGVVYQFSQQEVDRLRSAATDLHHMSMQAVGRVVRDDLFFRFGMDDDWSGFAANSWKQDDKAIVGRMDFIIDASGIPKLLEYNADCIGLTLEASVIQDLWGQSHGYSAQFNQLERELEAAWRSVNAQARLPRETVFAGFCAESAYAFAQTEYLRYTAQRAGFGGKTIDIGAVNWNGTHFTDENEVPADTLYVYSGWDQLAHSEFAHMIYEGKTRFIEPAWRAILGNKAILPILWEENKGYPNLLASFHSASQFNNGEGYVVKPLWGYAGDNVKIVDPQHGCSRSGRFGDEGVVYQEYCRNASFDGQHPVVSVWIVNDKPCAIGVREDRSRITNVDSFFVPHCVL